MESNFTPEQIAIIKQLIQDVLEELLVKDVLNQAHCPAPPADAPTEAAEK